MSQPTRITERAVDVANGRIKLRFKVGGEGPPLIYFHPAGGLLWDPFLARMAEHYTVYAPEFPGTSAGDPYAIHQIDDVWDAVLAYEEAIGGLGLDQPPVAVAQSFGAMLSLEVSASYPGVFAKHVVLDPPGLWREDAPVSNWMEASPPALAAMLFKDPSSPAAQAMLTLPEDPEAAVKAQAALVWALGCTGKLCWPIPDRGLHKRLHRIKTPTLIVWGADDALAPVVYAEEFHRRIAGSQVAIVPNSGHIPQVEQLDTTLDLVRRFLEKSE
jgi:pimeloyl-ACP methyl ester carboxylesterase